MAEINDRESAHAWLGQQPEYRQRFIAARAALRALPELGCDDPYLAVDGALLTFRAVLSAGVAAARLRSAAQADRSNALHAACADARRSLSDLHVGASKDAARHALQALRADAPIVAETLETARALADAAGKAAYAFVDPSRAYEAGRAAADATWVAFARDAEFLSEARDTESLFARPLWPKGMPEGLDLAYAELRRLWSQAPETWGFWQKWYVGMLDGRPMDWNLQADVAQIPNEIWQAGPEAVAREIERIEAAFLAGKLPLAEEIRINPESGKFFAEPVAAQKPALLAATLSQVADALEDVLAAPSNGLHENAREVRVVRRCLARYGNDPQRIEMDFTSVHGGLVRQVASGELPPSEENTALMEALANGARGIRGSDPEIAENRRILDGQAIAELPDEARHQLDAARPIIAAITERTLSESMAEDFAEVLDYAGRPSPFTHSKEGWDAVLNRDAKYRIFGRVAVMAVLARRYNSVMDKLCAATGFSRAEVVMALIGVVQIGVALI